MSPKTITNPKLRGVRLDILIILDPLHRLDPVTDTSLALAGEFISRGFQVWFADIPDLSLTSKGGEAHTSPVKFANGKYKLGKSTLRPLKSFNLIVIRKEPPFNEAYVTLTYMIETLFDSSCFLSNDPRGIRDTNEKMSIYHFPRMMPETMTTTSPHKIIHFQDKLRKPVVIKPLDEKGGKGVFKLPVTSPNRLKRLLSATCHGTKPVQAQAYISPGPRVREKRILILDGKLLGAYEKRAKAGEFRANLSLGGSIHRTKLTRAESALTRAIAHYAKKRGLHFVGIDVLGGKLIEINVTCPSGLLDLKLLEPGTEPVKAWADFLVLQALKKLKNR